jgi:hypothetical protein
MSGTREAPSNNLPVNQAALNWLRQAKASPQEGVSYLAQLASWGLEKGLVDVPAPVSASQPHRADLASAVDALLGFGRAEVAFATHWFLSNPNLAEDEQAESLEQQLDRATSPQEAAQVVVETAYDLMVAGSATNPA